MKETLQQLHLAFHNAINTIDNVKGFEAWAVTFVV